MIVRDAPWGSTRAANLPIGMASIWTKTSTRA